VHAREPPAWIMSEPEEVFEREVRRRHELPHRPGRASILDNAPTAAMDRAWLARVVVAQRVRATQTGNDR
jgi:hypothetical protein